MYKNDFETSIISTNVRHVFNDSFGSRTEIVAKPRFEFEHKLCKIILYNKILYDLILSYTT